MKFIPRQLKFYHFFTEQARLIADSAELLSESVSLDPAGAKRCFERITELESSGDAIMHKLSEQLRQTFITPLDPEDIHRLAERLDDILDGIEECGFRVMAYNVQPVPEAILNLADLVKLSCREVSAAVEALAAELPLDSHCTEISRIESEADRLYRDAEVVLFAEQPDAVTLLKQMRILGRLEKITDRCEDAGDVLENVVVKNS